VVPFVLKRTPLRFSRRWRLELIEKDEKCKVNRNASSIQLRDLSATLKFNNFSEAVHEVCWVYLIRITLQGEVTRNPGRVLSSGI
jgi:hypothetical protein